MPHVCIHRDADAHGNSTLDRQANQRQAIERQANELEITRSSCVESVTCVEAVTRAGCARLCMAIPVDDANGVVFSAALSSSRTPYTCTLVVVHNATLEQVEVQATMLGVGSSCPTDRNVPSLPSLDVEEDEEVDADDDDAPADAVLAFAVGGLQS